MWGRRRAGRRCRQARRAGAGRASEARRGVRCCSGGGRAAAGGGRAKGRERAAAAEAPRRRHSLRRLRAVTAGGWWRLLYSHSVEGRVQVEPVAWRGTALRHATRRTAWKESGIGNGAVSDLPKVPPPAQTSRSCLARPAWRSGRAGLGSPLGRIRRQLARQRRTIPQSASTPPASPCDPYRRLFGCYGASSRRS